MPFASPLEDSFNLSKDIFKLCPHSSPRAANHCISDPLCSFRPPDKNFLRSLRLSFKENERPTLSSSATVGTGPLSTSGPLCVDQGQSTMPRRDELRQCLVRGPLDPVPSHRWDYPRELTHVGPPCRKGYMGECDQPTTESILDYFYEQVSTLLAVPLSLISQKLTNYHREVSD
jgi:hypothetical protein